MPVRKLRALALCASWWLGCTGGGDSNPDDTSLDPGTVQDAHVPGRDASRDARPADTSVPPRDARAEPEDAHAEAGPTDAHVAPGDAGANVPPDASTNQGGTPVFVAVGEKGARLISRDLGKTWTHTAELVGGGDDGNLLRAITYANGLFVAVGWNIWTSPDGSTWTKRDNPAKQWMGGVEWGIPSGKSAGIFVAAGGSGTSVYSADGVTWSAGKDRNSEPARSVAFGDGRFVCGTDPPNWWTTTDGNNWTLDSTHPSTNAVIWCDGQFSEVKNCSKPIAHAGGRTAFGMGVYVSASREKIERSENGTSWTTVKDTKDSPVEDVAFGFID